jgi:hypothetical protein
MGLITLAAGTGVTIGLRTDADTVETGLSGLGLGFALQAVITRTVAIEINITHFNFKITPPSESVLPVASRRKQ